MSSLQIRQVSDLKSTGLGKYDMQSIYFNKGQTVRVCGGSKEIHRFNPEELVEVVLVRPELPIVALCKSTTRDHSEILLIEEVEEL